MNTWPRKRSGRTQNCGVWRQILSVNTGTVRLTLQYANIVCTCRIKHEVESRPICDCNCIFSCCWSVIQIHCQWDIDTHKFKLHFCPDFITQMQCIATLKGLQSACSYLLTTKPTEIDCCKQYSSSMVGKRRLCGSLAKL
jgi:hypothetical protein